MFGRVRPVIVSKNLPFPLSPFWGGERAYDVSRASPPPSPLCFGEEASLGWVGGGREVWGLLGVYERKRKKKGGGHQGEDEKILAVSPPLFWGAH